MRHLLGLALLLAGCASAPAPPDTAFQRELAADIEEMLRVWVMPVSGVGASDLVNSYGDARGSRRHEGIDIFAPRGTPVVAATAGYIARISYSERGGRVLWIESDGGPALYYAHLDRWQPGLAVGDRVSAGDVIGFVGNTGNAANGRPHLHFEIRVSDEPVNPYAVLIPDP